MKIKEYSPIGLEVINERHAIIIGISINNSYFKEENIEKLLLWATAHTEKVYIMIPDEPAIHTLVALGKSEKRAETLARLKSNSLENKCREIMKRFNLDARIIRWKSIRESQQYLSVLSKIERAYNAEIGFREAIREMTAKVLSNGKMVSTSDKEIEEGIKFLFKELAFIVYSDRILQEQKTAYVYHKTMHVMKDIFENRYSFRPSPNVGFLTVE